MQILHLAKKEFKVWPDIDEFEIYAETTLDNLAKCYRPSDTHGWCGTNMGDDISNPQFDIKADHGWGFCTDECFPDMTQPFYGKAREKLIHILDEEFCEGILKKGNILPLRETILPLRENFLPLRENCLLLRKNFLPLKENCLLLRKTFFHLI